MEANSEEQSLLGVKDIMNRMKIGRNKAYEIIESGELHVIQLGKRVYIHPEVFENWLKGKK
jgi:excisionase family DNA binding protein